MINYRYFSNYDQVNSINCLYEVLYKHEHQEHLLNEPDSREKVCSAILKS